MMEGRQHNNLWAEKLSQVSLPDSGMAWMAMEVILDEEMPTGWRKYWRQGLVLVLLLLLLIGVCNCPGRGRFSAVTTGDKIARGPSIAAGGRGPSPVVPPVSTPPSFSAIPPISRNITVTRYRYTLAAPPIATAPVKHRHLHSGSEETTAGGSPDTPGSNDPTGSPGSTDSKGSPASPESPKKKDSLVTPVRKSLVKDSTHKKPLTPASLTPPKPPTPAPSPKKKPEKQNESGFMAGIGLNQFFTVGGQQPSSWNSGGITGTLSDYIPVPMIRYYFNSRLYVQLEAQINTPQYTKKDLVLGETTTNAGNPVTTTPQSSVSVSVDKLFYFNLPLSVHYTIAKNLDLGTGLQYSQLTNGIGVFNTIYSNSTAITGYSPTIDSTATQTKSFKGDSFYRELKTHELRWLLDANYTYQHFIFGLRYNQALSKFVNVQVSSTQITQARNSSLQLYLRYILWDGRKKKPLLPAK